VNCSLLLSYNSSLTATDNDFNASQASNMGNAIGFTGNAGGTSYALNEIKDNTIIGSTSITSDAGYRFLISGNKMAATKTDGLYLNAKTDVTANLISGGNAAYAGANGFGVRINTTEVVRVLNNTILGGDFANSQPLNIQSGTNTSIVNNLLIGNSGDVRGAGQCDPINVAPLAFITNMIQCTDPGYYNGSNVTATADFVNFAGADLDPLTHGDNDWSLQNSTPAAIKTGGTTGITFGATDFAGQNRDTYGGATWSVGAYEAP
jgi:hypothetical protein